jgi:ABC-2 type transport system ATP-binding protein
MEEVEELCSRIAIMDQGRIIAQGSKDELKELVSSEDRIVVELAGINYTVVDEVKRIGGVKDCILTDTTLTILVAKNNSIIGRIVDAITNAGADVVNLSAEKPTLESVFLTLTGKTLRD